MSLTSFNLPAKFGENVVKTRAKTGAKNEISYSKELDRYSLNKIALKASNCSDPAPSRS